MIGEWIEKMVVLIVVLVVLFCVLAGIVGVNWAITCIIVDAVERKAVLLEKTYSPSTKKYHSVTTVGSNGGVGMGTVSTGDQEKFTTIWEVPGIGTLVSNKKHVFRKATDDSDCLLIKYVWDEYYITDLCEERR